MAAGDISGDGRPDLIVACPDPAALVLHVGTAELDGALAPADPRNINPGSVTYAVAVGDIDADGLVDLVLAVGAPNVVRVLYGTGAGAFAAPVDLRVTFLATALALDDLDHDGAVDLAAASGSWLSILRGRRVGCPE